MSAFSDRRWVFLQTGNVNISIQKVFLQEVCSQAGSDVSPYRKLCCFQTGSGCVSRQEVGQWELTLRRSPSGSSTLCSSIRPP